MRELKTRVSAVSGTLNQTTTHYTSADADKLITYAPHGAITSMTLGS